MDKMISGEISLQDAQRLNKRFKEQSGVSPTKESKPKKSIQKPKSISSLKDATDATDAEMKKAYKGWTDNLSTNERENLLFYQGSDYIHINSNLRGGTPSIVSEETAAIDKSISKSSVPRNMTVYRGTPLDVYTSQLGDDPSKWVGRTFEDKGYMSTTLDKEVAFNGVQARIKVPKGTKAGYLEYVEDPDIGFGEKELLLGRGTKMRITGVDIGPDGQIKGIETEVLK
jgi:hypothetical protein